MVVITSREVFEARKAGQLMDALNMGRELVASNPHDAWNVKALAWTIVDLIKAASVKNDTQFIQALASELKGLNFDKSDDVLMKGVNYVLMLANPQTKIIADARLLSKQGNHSEAIKAYKVALQHFPNDSSVHEGLGWELYKHGKQFFYGDDIITCG